MCFRQTTDGIFPTVIMTGIHLSLIPAVGIIITVRYTPNLQLTYTFPLISESILLNEGVCYKWTVQLKFYQWHNFESCWRYRYMYMCVVLEWYAMYKFYVGFGLIQFKSTVNVTHIIRRKVNFTYISCKLILCESLLESLTWQWIGQLYLSLISRFISHATLK